VVVQLAKRANGEAEAMKRMLGGREHGIGLGLAALVLGAVALTPVVHADDVGQGAAGAARLSSVDGQVRLSQGGQVIADPAVINAPLFAGTRVETGDDGKAEIQFDDGSVARLSPDSTLTLTSVGGQGGAAIVLEGGLGYFELQGGGQGGQMRVAFGDSVATATGFTVMRIKLDNPPGEIAVFSGNAHVERGNSLAVDLHGGESVGLNGNDPSQYNLAETIEPDSWDAWNTDRDQALNAEAADQTGAANNFVNNSAPNPAWNDLDANGSWYNVPGQGYIWSPYEASNAGWDPYGNGNWMWTPGYGYIFVSGNPWGYMPYQCGMWNYYDGFGWGWAPGMGMGVNLRMGGCHPWWGRGGAGYGLNIGRAPVGYRSIVMPRAPGGLGRTPPKVISVNRGGFAERTSGVPARNINTAVQIGGQTVMPLRPMPTHQTYRSSDSGYVYRPAGGYKGTTTPGNYVYSSGPASNAHVSPGGRQSYVAPAPRYTAIPAPPPPTPSAVAPGGANGAPNPGAAPGGPPAMGGLVSRDYYRSHPDAGVDRHGNGTAETPGNGNPGANPGTEQNIRPWYNSNPGAGGSNARPSGGNSNGGSFNRPSNPGGSAPAPRPSSPPPPSSAPRGGGAPSGGGGGGGASHGGNTGHK